MTEKKVGDLQVGDLVRVKEELCKINRLRFYGIGKFGHPKCQFFANAIFENDEEYSDITPSHHLITVFSVEYVVAEFLNIGISFVSVSINNEIFEIKFKIMDEILTEIYKNKHLDMSLKIMCFEEKKKIVEILEIY